MIPVTIVMSVTNRPKLLRNALTSWARIDYPNYQMIMIDDATGNPEIEAIAEDFKSRMPLTFHKEPVWRNIHNIWNKYGKAADGEYVIFSMADEIVSHRDVVQRMVNFSETSRTSIFTYFMNQVETDSLGLMQWQDDPLVIPKPFTDQTTAGLISHITGNWKKNWDWFGWFREEDGHLWLDQDVHLREVRLGVAAVTPPEVYCLHQYHPPVMPRTAAPGYTYQNEMQARLLEPAVRDAN
jgi:hypothetical protein